MRRWEPMRYAAVLVVALAGCPSDDPPPPDAPSSIDAPAGNVCTGLLYDRCTDNTQCMSGNCRMFNNIGVSLCTQACTVGGAACPMQGATAVSCSNGAGGSNVCRPAAANTCTPP